MKFTENGGKKFRISGNRRIGENLSILTEGGSRQKKATSLEEAAFDSLPADCLRHGEPKQSGLLQVLRLDSAAPVCLGAANGRIEQLINFVVQGCD